MEKRNRKYKAKAIQEIQQLDSVLQQHEKSDSDVESNSDDDNLGQSSEHSNIVFDVNYQSNNSDHYDSEDSDSETSDSENEEEGLCQDRFRQQIKSFCIDSNLPGARINEMLSILRRAGHALPKDYRTLIGSPAKISTIDRCNGKYIYLGLKEV